MFLLNGKALAIDAPFEHEGVRYPANWLRLSTLEEKEAIGITEVTEEPRPDDRFYWVTDNGDGTYTATPKDLDTLKAAWLQSINQTAYQSLLASDWLVVRKAETGTPIPPEWEAYRASVRSAASANETALNDAPDFDTFVAVATTLEWPATPTD